MVEGVHKLLVSMILGMSDLSILREGRDLIQKEETRLLRAITVQESLKQWIRMQRAFEWQLQQTRGT